MRVLFTHPYFWPHVRRGAEREIHDLGNRISAEDLRVTLLTSMPTGSLRRARYGALGVRYVRLPLNAPLARRGVTDNAAFAAAALPYVAASGADLVHAWHYGDAWAAVQAKRIRRRRPVVLKLTGTVVPDRMAKVRFDRRLFRDAVAGADEVWCNSPFARDAMLDFGRPMEVVPAGVDLDRFRPTVPRRDPPTVLCASAPDDPRKRLVDVVDGWPAVLDAVPTARLVLAGRGAGDVRRQLVDRLPVGAQSSVDIVGDLADDVLVDAYSSASTVVAPGVHEALGLSTIEALACGTPVAGARSGATSGLVEPGVTGSLFEPADPADLARAVVESLALSGRPGTADACRASAIPFGWDEIVPLVRRRWVALLESC